MSKFKFLSDEDTNPNFADIYQTLINSTDVGDNLLAQTFLSEPVDVVIEEYLQGLGPIAIEQFREWRTYNGDWWRDDEEIVRCMEGMQGVERPNDAPYIRKFISRQLMRNPSFSLEQKCDQLKLELLENLMMDRVKHQFNQLPDGIEIITYFE